jgi:beta-hydroxylase
MTAVDDPRPTTSIRPTLVNDDLQEQFRRDGFVVVPLLDAARTIEAADLFAALGDPPSTGFQTDFEHPDPQRKARIHEDIVALAGPAIAGVLDRYHPFMTTFLAKWPGEGSALYVHQDWTYVDEERFRSVVVWIALTDTSEERGNGPLRVLPGSHRIVGEYRGTRTSPWYADRVGAIDAAMMPVSVAAGDAVIMDNALIHSSPDNTSSELRLAVALACVPTEAGLIHAVDRDDGQIDLLDVDERFFREQTPQALRERIPEPWSDTARPTVRRWTSLDERLAERLAGGTLSVEGAGGPLGGSQSPPPGPTRASRALAGVLAFNHLHLTAADARYPGPFIDAAAIPWLADLEAAWEEIAAEYVAAAAGGSAPVPLETLAGTALPNVGAWRALLLKDNLGWADRNTARCPTTTGLLRAVPGVRSAMFSVLGPWARIDAHRGPNKGVLRAHLGLVVPGPPGRVTMWAGSEQVSWEEGRAFCFDDTYEHRVANRTDGTRVSLMVEFDRPLPPREAQVNRLVQWGFRWHPQIRGARDRQRAIDAALDA